MVSKKRTRKNKKGGMERLLTGTWLPSNAPPAEQIANAIKMGQTGRVKYLIKKLQKPSEKNSVLNAVDSRNQGLLQNAYLGNHMDIFEYLLDEGVKDIGDKRFNILTLAIHKNDKDTILSLLNHNATNVTDFHYEYANLMNPNYDDESLNEQFLDIKKILARELVKNGSNNHLDLTAEPYRPIVSENVAPFIDKEVVNVDMGDHNISLAYPLDRQEISGNVVRNKLSDIDDNDDVEMQPYEFLNKHHDSHELSEIQIATKFGGKNKKSRKRMHSKRRYRKTFNYKKK